MKVLKLQLRIMLMKTIY